MYVTRVNILVDKEYYLNNNNSHVLPIAWFALDYTKEFTNIKDLFKVLRVSRLHNMQTLHLHGNVQKFLHNNMLNTNFESSMKKTWE